MHRKLIKNISSSIRNSYSRSTNNIQRNQNKSFFAEHQRFYSTKVDKNRQIVEEEIKKVGDEIGIVNSEIKAIMNKAEINKKDKDTLKYLSDDEAKLSDKEAKLRDEESYLLNVDVERSSRVIKGLAKEIRECAISKLQNSDLKLVSLTGDHKWLTFHSPHLFIRKHYDLMWEKIQTAYEEYINNIPYCYERVLILGNPGIGKTASANFLLIKALQNNYPVLFETRDTRYYFEPGNDDVECESLGCFGIDALENHRFNKNVILLHDHIAKQEPPLLQNHAFTIAPIGLDPSNFKQFSKHSPLEIWMPLTTRDEALAMASILFRDKSLNYFEDRIKKYGSVARLVFTSSYNDRHLANEIASFDLTKVFSNDAFLVSGLLPADLIDLSLQILNIEADCDLSCPISVDFASDYIRNEIIKKNAGKKELEQLLNKILKEGKLGLFDDKGKMYECWGIHKISSGTKLEPSNLFDDNTSGVSNEDLKIVLSHGLRNVATYPSIKEFSKSENAGFLFYSEIPKNYPDFDGAAFSGNQLLLFQITTGGTHTIKISSSSNKLLIRHALKRGIKVRYIFVVPSKDRFKIDSEQLKKFVIKHSNISIEIAELYPGK